jgi:hypothetical protein
MDGSKAHSGVGENERIPTEKSEQSFLQYQNECFLTEKANNPSLVAAEKNQHDSICTSRAPKNQRVQTNGVYLHLESSTQESQEK